MKLISSFLALIYALEISAKSITITWSTPSNSLKPATGKETLLAISIHLQALHLADLVPRLLRIDQSLQIKLCPPQPYDPLVKEFTVPRISGYTALYDHECIQNNQDVNAQWGSKPKPPSTPPKTTPIHGGARGLSVPSFIVELYSHHKSIKDDNQLLWLLDSDSLRPWLAAPTLHFLAKQSSKHSIPPATLMHQINAMYGNLGEKDLKNMPQAVQNSLLILLPDYTNWRFALPTKTFFNPTWWSTRSFPRSKDQIIQLLSNIIKATRKSDQLVIIHHEPTPLNFEIVNQLVKLYGEKNLISSTRVLPKTATTFQTLQFIQKAPNLVVDKRDLLGQISLLSTGFPRSVHNFQQFLSYTLSETIFISVMTIWLIGVFLVRAYFTYKDYQIPLHEHALRLILTSFLAAAPVIALNPSLWPSTASTLVYGVFESGYAFILYGIVIFYATAAFITVLVVIHDKYKKAKIEKEKIDDEEASDTESDTESLHLVPK